MGGREQLVRVKRATHIYNTEVEGPREVSRWLHGYTMLMQSSLQAGLNVCTDCTCRLHDFTMVKPFSLYEQNVLWSRLHMALVISSHHVFFYSLCITPWTVHAAYMCSLLSER